MDGDHSAKSMEQGANAAMKDQEMTSGIHESVNQVVGLPVPSPAYLYLANSSGSPLLAKRPKEPEQACSPKMALSDPCSLVRRLATSS